LIIAIVQFIRASVMYLQKQTGGKPPNQLQKALFCMIQCCLKCLECCLDKINKNALVWTAITGDNFCVAACSSFALVWKNLGRVAAVSIVSNLIIAFSQVAIAALTAGIAGLILMYAHFYQQRISGPLVPMGVVFVFAWMTARCFLIIFQAVIDTLFLCFLFDEASNASAGTMLAPKRLARLVADPVFYKLNQRSAEQQRQLQADRKTGKLSTEVSVTDPVSVVSRTVDDSHRPQTQVAWHKTEV